MADRPPTFDHMMSQKKPRTERVPILDDDAVDAYDLAWEELERAIQMRSSDEDLEALREAVEGAADRVRETTTHIVVRSIGRQAYEELVKEHQDIPETQQAEWREVYGEKSYPPWNMDTFPAAVVAASAVAPKMTVEQAQELFNKWNPEEVQGVYEAALRVNTRKRTAELGKERGRIRPATR